MKYKKWCFAMLGMTAAVLLFIAGVNYYADIFGYFTFQSGDYRDVDFKLDDNSTYYRVLKANHVLNFGGQYDAYILGGSKTGSFRAESLQELDGYRYYNLYELHGTVTEYQTIAEFLLKHTQVKKIIVNLSSTEAERLVYQSDADVMQIPAVWKDEPQIGEYIHFLTLDVTDSLKAIWDRIQNGKKTYTKNYTGGERNLNSKYNSRKKDPEHFIEKNPMKRYNARLKVLFEDHSNLPCYEECLETLCRIKASCEEKDVEFELWLAPTFLSGMRSFEGIYFWNYMYELAQITDYWDFNGFSAVNLNPYNYVDHFHCTYELADFVIDTVAGKDSYPGFGYHVTKENVEEYLRQRREDYSRLKQEFLKTGTVATYGAEDDSNIYARMTS